MGLMLHAKTRKRNLVDKLSNLGLCISYDRVQSLSAEIWNSVCQQFHKEQVVCLPALKQGVLTISAVDKLITIQVLPLLLIRSMELGFFDSIPLQHF